MTEQRDKQHFNIFSRSLLRNLLQYLQVDSVNFGPILVPAPLKKISQDEVE